jgi:hypothetical protein
MSDVCHALARVAPIRRDISALVAVTIEPVVEAIRNPAVVLWVGITGIYPIEKLISAVGANVMDFTRQPAAISVLPGIRIERRHYSVGFEPPRIPNLVGLSLQPVLANERQASGVRILIGEIGQLYKLVTQVFPASLVARGIAKVKRPPGT